MAIARHWLASARVAASQCVEVRAVLAASAASSSSRGSIVPPRAYASPVRLHFHSCAPIAAEASAADARREEADTSAAADGEAGTEKPTDSSESDSKHTNSEEADEKTESDPSDGSEAESEESSRASGASSASDASGPAVQSRLSFAWDVLKEAIGLGSSSSGPTGDKSAAEDYPWVEFPDEHGTVHYRNRVTGQVTETMPDDFEKYGRALEVDSETLALTVVDVKKTRWERYREMLSDSPFMRAVDEAAAGMRESEVAQRIDAARDDLQTQWETSQNPIVYRAASAYDAVFAETEQARAVARIQELDPKFDGGAGFLTECRDVILPSVVSALLRGHRVELDGWCTSDCMARVNAVLRARETEALSVDSTILSTSQVSVAGAKVLEIGPPIVLVTGMVQQLHCIRNKEGKVVEGSEDEIRAVMYALGLQRVYIPEKGGLVWQVAELSYTGGQLYL